MVQPVVKAAPKPAVKAAAKAAAPKTKVEKTPAGGKRPAPDPKATPAKKRAK